MSYNTLSTSEKWIMKVIPIIFLIGSCMHFLYDFSGKSIIIGLIAPVNESVWEHTKMVLLPMIGWWVIYYFSFGIRNKIDQRKWFTGALVSLLISILSIPMLYYSYTEAFGVEILAVDIIILLIAIIFGQLLGFHFYKYSKGISSYISIGIMLGLIILFALFTFYPPHIPLFRDSITGQYGIS